VTCYLSVSYDDQAWGGFAAERELSLTDAAGIQAFTMKYGLGVPDSGGTLTAVLQTKENGKTKIVSNVSTQKIEPQ